MICPLCGKKFNVFFYALRDTKERENWFQWYWRHLMGIMTFGYTKRKHYRVVVPFCNACSDLIIKWNKQNQL